MYTKSRAFFDRGDSRELRWRKQVLRKLKTSLISSEAALTDALRRDLGKGETEALATEICFVIQEIDHALKHIDMWAENVRVKVPLISHPGKAWYRPEPKGSVLIIAPWNYPVNLALSPVVAAVAAGNTVVLKPSELAPSVSRALINMISTAFADGEIMCAEGGVDVSKELLRQPFDHFFFTGSASVGREVAIAAAGHLSTCTLELGGKSPCIVDESANIKEAAKRIAWGKTVNAGQTCVAPDYVLAHADIYDRLVDEIVKSWAAFYGAQPEHSPDYGRIINERHFKRLTTYLDKTKSRVIGGHHDISSRFIEPTILADITTDHPAMSEEIFGPILPVLRWRTEQDLIDMILRHPNPLALYVFSRRRDFQETLMTRVSSGGVAINHVIHQMACPDLPFGGVKSSGMGRYHGKFGFDEFSRFKAVYEAAGSFDFALKYPPYRWISKLLRLRYY